MLLHYPLHVGLILAESSLGILVEVVGEVEEVEAEAAGEVVAEAAEGSAESAERALMTLVSRNAEASGSAVEAHNPSSNQVWLLCGAWGLALTALILISLTHKKKRRWKPAHVIALATRCLTTVLLLTAVPLASRGKLKALPLLFIVCGLLVGTVLIEFVAVTYDDHLRVKEAGLGGDAADGVDEEDGPRSSVGSEDSGKEHWHDRHGGPFPHGVLTGVSSVPRELPIVHSKSPFHRFSLH